MNDREIMENFIRTARAIAQISDDSHFEIKFTDADDKKHVLKVDLLSEDGTTEVEDKHHNECMQITQYSDELNEARGIIGNLLKFMTGFAYPETAVRTEMAALARTAEEFLAKTENFPTIDCDYYSPSDRKCTYGDGENYCVEGPCEVWEQQREVKHD